MCIMVRQHIPSPILCEIAPDTVDMIGMVLRVVILDQNRRPFDGIVVPLAALLGTSPGEGQLVQARPLDPRPDVCAHLIGTPLDIVAEQLDQMATLRSRECGVGDAAWYGCGINHPVIPAMDADPLFVVEGDIDAARALVEAADEAELFL